MAEIETQLLGRAHPDRRIGSVKEFTNEVTAYLAGKMLNPNQSIGNSPTKKPESNSNHSIQKFEFYVTLELQITDNEIYSIYHDI